MSPTRVVHAIAVASLVALAAGIIEWTQVSALGVASAVVLLLPLRSIVRGSTYTCGWASMLVVCYCSFLLAEVYAQPQQKAWPLMLSAVSALNFLSLIMYVRLRARERAALLAPAAASGAVSH